jgi:hypothetical protein
MKIPEDEKLNIARWLFGAVVYLLLAWAYVELTDEGWHTFWIAVGVLLAARFFFVLVDLFGMVLTWRLYVKKFLVNKNLAQLSGYQFPKRKYSHDDFSDYLSRIASDEEYAPALKAAAKEWYFLLSIHERFGILHGARMWSAAEKALDIYSPKSEAPVFGADGK